MPMPTFRRAADIQTTDEKPAATKPAEGNNLYPGPCTKCGATVPAMQGRRNKVDGKWVVTHIGDGCDKPVEETAVVETKRDVNVAANGQTLFDGRYTWETLTSYRTFRLRTQEVDADFMPGVQIIQHLTGPDNSADYQSIGHVINGRPRIWKKHQDKQTLIKDVLEFFANPEQALLVAQCFACHRDLTVPASIHAGYGPECAKRVG